MNTTTTLGTMAGLLTLALSVSHCIPKDAPGTAGAAAAANCKPASMIEDGEDNNNQVVVQEGRSGYVYTFLDSDGSTISPNSDDGPFAPASGGAEGSGYALHMKGKIGTAEIVYAGLGLNFMDPKGKYDASKYSGLSFRAKATSGTPNVRLKVPDVNTDPAGNNCSECFNDFGYDLTLGSEWQQYVIPFSDMSQLSGWGSPNPSAIDASQIYGVQFQVNDKGADYDVWIDDIQFISCG